MCLPKKKGAGIGELTAFAMVCVGMGYSDFLGMDTDDFAAVARAYNRMEESRERGACRAAEDGREVLGALYWSLSLNSQSSLMLSIVTNEKTNAIASTKIRMNIVGSRVVSSRKKRSIPARKRITDTTLAVSYLLL